MALFNFNIYYQEEKVLKEIKQLRKFIMATFQEIKQEFEALKQAIADERQQANAKLAELQTSIDELTANIQNGGDETQRAELLADIQTQVNEVKAIIPDAPTEPVV